MKRLLWIVLALVFAPLMIYGGFQAALKNRFDRDAPKTSFPKPASRAEARAQDLEHLGLFLELERSFTPETLARAQVLFEELKKEARGMTDAQFEMAVTRLVAAADNGHTKVREYDRTPRYNRLPVRGHLFDDGYFIIRATSGSYDSLGRKWVALDGRPMAEVMAELRPYVGGTDQIFRKYLPYLIESPELLHAIGLASEPDAMRLTLETPEGALDDVRFEGPWPSSSEQIARSHVLLAPFVYSESQPDWRSVYPEDQNVPLYLRQAANGFALEHIPQIDAVYLQYWSNNDGASETVGAFQRRASAMLDQIRPRNIILDHRLNGGGNYLKTRKFMQGLPDFLSDDGRLWIVTGPTTFSAGSFSVAFAKGAAKERAIIIGSRLADKVPSWGEDNLLLLPNSKIQINFSTGKHNPWEGCHSWRDCFWTDFLHPVAAGSPDPDIEVPYTFADYMSGRDPVLDAITARNPRS